MSRALLSEFADSGTSIRRTVETENSRRTLESSEVNKPESKHVRQFRVSITRLFESRGPAQTSARAAKEDGGEGRGERQRRTQRKANYDDCTSEREPAKTLAEARSNPGPFKSRADAASTSFFA